MDLKLESINSRDEQEEWSHEPRFTTCPDASDVELLQHYVQKSEMANRVREGEKW